MKLVVAVDRGWGIGKGGELLCRVREDLKSFRALTQSKAVILGSKTLATFPGGRPLKNRRNIIMSRRPDYSVEGAEVVRSTDELLSLLERDGLLEDAVVIGGESIYKELLRYCDEAFVTVFDTRLDADAFFPDLDLDPCWEIVSKSETFLSEEDDLPPGMKYNFLTYKRK